MSYVFETYKDKKGEWRWRLRAPNKNIIADGGEGYKNKADCEAGIASIKKNSPTAKVVETK